MVGAGRNRQSACPIFGVQVYDFAGGAYMARRPSTSPFDFALHHIVRGFAHGPELVEGLRAVRSAPLRTVSEGRTVSPSNAGGMCAM